MIEKGNVLPHKIPDRNLIIGNIVLGVIIITWLSVLTYFIMRNEKRISLLYISNGSNSKLKGSAVPKNLYNYHTRNNDINLNSYIGHFLITYSPIGSVKFTVTDQTGKNITSNITNPSYSNIPTKVEFNSSDPTSLLSLNYTSHNDFDLERLEISI